MTPRRGQGDSPAADLSREPADAPVPGAVGEAPDAGPVGDAELLLSASDQTVADSDQSLSDSDQTSSDIDQTSSESDQIAADRDQAASDRDLAAGVDRHEYQITREIRERSREQRGLSAQARLQAANQRDAVAEARDVAALARDRVSAARDQAMAQTDTAALEATSRGDLSVERLVRAIKQRRRAAEYRLFAAENRAMAADDRHAAATDRQCAADERLRALADREDLAAQLALAQTDPLTGARTRAAGLADLDRELDRCRRTDTLFVVAYADITGLKKVNDALGHAASDELLRRLASLFKTHLRPYDLIVRLGSGEFLCAIPNMPEADVRERFAAISGELAAGREPAGVRTGFATLRDGEGAAELIARADAELRRQ
jgi:diguanylate cyclase (GGDEF)-like protein